ncbi:unnamed protein product, partial [Scytosiphon promiscuus]
RLSPAPAAAAVSDGTTSASNQARARVATATPPSWPQTALSPPPEGAQEKTKEGAHFLPVPPFHVNGFLAASGIIIIIVIIIIITVAFFDGRLRKNQRHGRRGEASQRSSRLSADTRRAAADEALNVFRTDSARRRTRSQRPGSCVQTLCMSSPLLDRRAPPSARSWRRR